MKNAIRRVIVLTHGVPTVSADSLRLTLAVLQERNIDVLIPASEREKHGDLLGDAGHVMVAGDEEDFLGAGLCLVLGGDGTMLRGFRLTRGRGIPVAGVNLGRVGFLTTVPREELASGIGRLLDGDFVEYPLLGLEANLGATQFQAANDVVVSRGERPHACSLALTINGVTLFEVLCDGVVVATPVGSSAYSLAAGGPLVGITVDAYVITLVAAHSVGVRPVVAAPQDVLEVTNTDGTADCYLDVDGQRLATLTPGATLRVRTGEALTSLALLQGDSLYHHFRDRLF